MRRANSATQAEDKRFNSRTPCGVRPSEKRAIKLSVRFQFTHPVWGATSLLLGRNEQQKCFNSRTPCGVRHLERLFPLLAVEFQFTHPVWGATEWCLYPASVPDVSIHAPRVGCDHRTLSTQHGNLCFNSRTPCGVRLTSFEVGGVSRGFNSRTPCGVRLDYHKCLACGYKFQFTHPVWGATGADGVYAGQAGVSIHAPRVGCDPLVYPQPAKPPVSIHAPRVGCDNQSI